MNKKDIDIQELKDQFKAGKLQRRHIRNKLFRIRDNMYEDVDNLKEYIGKQLGDKHKWEGFTFDWDVSVQDPFKVITIDEWVKSGGKFDEMGRRTPPGFTNQK